MSSRSILRARRWRAGLAVVGAAVLALMSVSAYADNITLDIAASGPTTITLSGGSAQTTIKYYLAPNGHSACSASSNTHIIYDINIGAPTGVAASQSKLDFTSCNVDIPVTFTATSAGSRSVTLTKDAASGDTANPSNAAFTLVVNPPSNTAPHVSVAGVTDGASYAFGNVPAASCSVTDAEDPNPSATPTLSAVTGPLSQYGLGSQTATCTYTDKGGLSDTATATYSIVDKQQPTLSTPGDQTLEATGPSGAEATWSLSADDNVALAGPASCDYASPHTFDVGSTVVTCSVTDVAGNSKSGKFTVTVTDKTAPSLLVSSDVTVEATSGAGATATYDDPSASDLHDGTVTASCAPASGSLFALGNTAVGCSASDSAGNTATGGFTVHVLDRTPPTVNVPASKTLEATSPAGAVATFAVTASDIVDGATSVSCDHNSGDTFGFGTTTVSCSATDAHSNTGYGSFTVTVQDTTDPVLDAHADVTAEATGPTGATVNYTKPGASDDASTTVTVDCIPSTGSLFSLGSTTVNCTATDEHGNHDTSHFEVKVEDKTAPTISNVPDDITTEATGASGAAVSFSGATASDIVDGPVSVSYSPASGSTFALGTHTVTVSATDAHNNTATETFDVTVVDTTAPVISKVPSDITAEATGASGATVTFGGATASDLVDGSVSVSYSPASGSTFALGTHTVTVSATDAHNNTSTETFHVTVVDTTGPGLANMPGNTTGIATSANGAVVTFGAPTALDLVDGVVTPSCTPASGSLFAIGKTKVTCSASDSRGNVGSASFDVNVIVPWNGILQPVNADGMSAFKLGSTVPVKFKGFAGLNAKLTVTQKDGTPEGTELEPVNSNPADSGWVFRYDAVAGQYIYNLGTKNMTAGDWYLHIDLGDHVDHVVKFSLKR